MIRRRHLRGIIALLLPLMVLRGLLPAGFMPVVEHGEFRVVMCSAGIQLPAADGRNTHNSHQLPSDMGSCPFAHAATAAPPIQHVVQVIAPLREIRFLSLTVDTLPPATGPPRTSAARAPPALS